MDIDTGRGSCTLGEHQFAILKSDAKLTATSPGASARFEARFSSTRLSVERFRELLGTSFDVPEPYWQLTIATLNTLIAAPPDANGGGSALIRGVLEELILSVLAEVQAGELVRSGSHAEQLQWDATRLIGLHFAEPDFSVQTLSSKLAVSQTHLHRIFAELNTTPRKAIERARVDAANSALNLGSTASAGDIEEIALNSGFRSVRQMRAAIARWA